MLTKEITTPINAKPYYVNEGVIKVYDRYNNVYSVGEVRLERFDEENFQYIFTPYWEYIEFIPDGVFNGIPGIDLEHRQKHYYRVNMTPAFIAMRTPSEQRADVKELMARAGLDYYDRFEWLLRTESRCGDDNLFVVRKEAGEKKFSSKIEVKRLNRESVIVGDSYKETLNSSNQICKLYEILQSGAVIKNGNRERLTEKDRFAQLSLLKQMQARFYEDYRNRRAQGIRIAKARGAYKGRIPIKIDEDLLRSTALSFKNGKMTEIEAMEALGINSRSTFYRKIKACKI